MNLRFIKHNKAIKKIFQIILKQRQIHFGSNNAYSLFIGQHPGHLPFRDIIKYQIIVDYVFKCAIYHLFWIHYGRYWLFNCKSNTRSTFSCMQTICNQLASIALSCQVDHIFKIFLVLDLDRLLYIFLNLFEISTIDWYNCVSNKDTETSFNISAESPALPDLTL